MLKNIVRLEHKVGDRIYHLLCDQDSPLHEVKEALSQFMGYAVSVENAAKSQAQAKPENSQEDLPAEDKSLPPEVVD